MTEPHSASPPSARRPESAANVPSPEEVPDRLTWYLVLLLVFLALAGFFDSFATTFRYTMVTYVRQDFQIGLGSMVSMYSWVYLGSCLSFIPRVLADVCGRKVMLWTTMAGLCFLQWMVGFARTPTEYIVLISFLSVFYKSDIWQLVISEEAPPRHRGLFAAVAAVFSAGGGVVVGALIRQMGTTPDAWREVARFPIWGVFAAIPVILFMRETRHFRRVKRRPRRHTGLALLRAPFRPEFRKPLLVLSALKMLFAGGAIVTVALLGTEYLRVENGFGPAVVGRVIQYEVVAIMAAWLTAGFFSDRIGRHACLYIFGTMYVAALVSLALLPAGSTGVIVAFVAQVYAAMAVYAILRVTTMEIFPNDCRATGSAWTDLFMTIFAAVTATVLGYLTDSTGPQGRRVELSTCILAAAGLALFVLPFFSLIRETSGRRLEEV